MGVEPEGLASPTFWIVPTPFRSADGVKTSMSELFCSPPMGALLRPAVMTTRPSESSVRVGYQRPSRMCGCTVQVSLNGLNVRTASRPWYFWLASVQYALFPPATSTRPSRSKTWPEHQRL